MPTNVRFIYGHFTDKKAASASTETTGFPAENAVDMDRSTYWLAQVEAAPQITVDLGAATTVTGLGVCNHNFKTMIDASYGLLLKGSTDNFVASNDLLENITPTNDDDYYQDGFSHNYRYFRIKATAGSGLSMKVGVFYLGTTLTLDANPDTDGGFRDELQSVDLVSRSLAGVSVVKQMGRSVYETRMAFTNRPVAEHDDAVTLYNSQTRLKPLMYIPRADAGTPAEGNARFVRFTDPKLPSSEVWADIWNFELNVREEP
jgi:hypothetical protein